MAGATFLVLLEILGEVQGFEGRLEFDSPRRMLGCVEAFTHVVVSKSLLQIGRMATIELCGMRNALESVGIEYGALFSPGGPSWEVRKGRTAADGLPSATRNRVT